MAGDRYPVLLHCLQERRLRARTRAVNLVRHQELAERRALDKAEVAAARLAFLQNLGAEDVGRHQVRGELHPSCLEAEDDAEGFHQPRLAEAGNADDEQMAARQDGR